MRALIYLLCLPFMPFVYLWTFFKGSSNKKTKKVKRTRFERNMEQIKSIADSIEDDGDKLPSSSEEIDDWCLGPKGMPYGIPQKYRQGALQVKMLNYSTDPQNRKIKVRNDWIRKHKCEVEKPRPSQQSLADQVDPHLDFGNE